MPHSNPYTNNPATEAQIRYIERLGGDALHAHKLSKREASAMIDELKASQHQLSLLNPAPSAPAPEQRSSAPDEAITPGVYQLDGVVYIVKPNRAKTRLYAKKLVESAGPRLSESGEHIEYELEYAPGIIFKLREEHRMPFEEAKRLTARYGRCIVCSRHLKAAESVEQGIGPVCRKSFKH